MSFMETDVLPKNKTAVCGRSQDRLSLKVIEPEYLVSNPPMILERAFSTARGQGYTVFHYGSLQG
jgi:hypothetical protein